MTPSNLLKIATNPYIIISLLICVTFAPALKNEFVWDDYNLILNNPKIDIPLKDFPSIFKEPLWQNTENLQIYYRPLVFIMFVVNYKIFGTSPAGFHLTNIILHGFVALLLYKIGTLLFDGNKFSALTAASIFTVHPVNNEPLGRAASGEVIFGFFIILSLYLFLRNASYLSWLAFFLALLSKESAVMLPLALVIFLYQRENNKKLFSVLPYVVLIGVYLILRIFIAGTVLGDVSAQPISTRVFTMAAATFDYARLLLLPYPLKPYYPARWFASIIEPKVLLAIPVLALIFYLAFRLRKDKRILFLLLFPFIMLAPAIWKVNAFPVGDYESAAIAERFLYVPVIGFSLFIAGSANKLLKYQKNITKNHLIIGTVLVIIVFSGITVGFNKTWKNDATLFTIIIKDTPSAGFAHNNLAIWYHKHGLLDNAITELQKAKAVKPDYAEAYYNLGLAYYEIGRFDDAIIEYLTALKFKPGYTKAYINLGIAYTAQGKIAEAIQTYKAALLLKPDFIDAYFNLANAYYSQGNLEEAKAAFFNVIQLKPDYAEAHSNLGTLFMASGDIDKGIEYFKNALRLKPDLVGIHINLGLAFKQKGLKDEAIKEFESALKLRPDNNEARQQLSLLLNSSENR